MSDAAEMHYRNSKKMCMSIVCLLGLLAYFIQSLGLLNSDAASLLYDTKLLLAGGHYVKDFFETNPPLILYIYSPVILLEKLTLFNLASLFRIYVIFSAIISIACCATLLNWVCAKKEEHLIFEVFVYMLAFILLFLPANEFGQREHFLMIFMLPYLFSAVLAAKSKKIPFFFACLIGLMGGFGFGLKPYFLGSVILIELYFIFSKRQLFAWVRVESVACILVLIVYLASIFIFQPNYINTMLPLISHLYFVSIKESWPTIFYRPSVIFCFLVWAYYFFIFHKNSQSELVTILMLALTGMIIAFIVPRSAWYYHVLPAFGLACLLASFYICHALTVPLNEGMLSKIDVFVIIAASFFVFSIPLEYAFLNTEKAILEKNNSDFRLLTAYINSLPVFRSLYCFSSNTTRDCFPLIYQTHSEFASRFPLFWWLRGLIKIENNGGAKPLPLFLAQDKKYLIDAIADDLTQHHAKIVIINNLLTTWELGSNFNFISYFSTNKKFRTAWRSYHYLASIGIYTLYVRS
ncbi:MAG: hypothetical protein K0S27_570 [Gammaproteobacteria bacterium]|jgi:hypothetical protein|nr:hypothetical protein [Gammaproteobacteria bacterium]